MLQPQVAIGQPASNDAGVGYLNLSSEEREDAAARRGDLQGTVLLLSRPRWQRGAAWPARRRAPADGAALAGFGARRRVIATTSIKVLLHGLTGPIDGKEYNGGAVMVPMGANTDEWISDVANYVRNAFGNAGRPVHHAGAGGGRAQEPLRAKRRGRSPSSSRRSRLLLANMADWKVSASHNTEAAANISAGARTLGYRRAAGAGHVVPNRAAAGGDHRGSAVRFSRPAAAAMAASAASADWA